MAVVYFKVSSSASGTTGLGSATLQPVPKVFRFKRRLRSHVQAFPAFRGAGGGDVQVFGFKALRLGGVGPTVQGDDDPSTPQHNVDPNPCNEF